MYCPKCKIEVNGRFCPDCGTPTVAVLDNSIPKVNISFGDANAISGDVHITNSIVERDKTDNEIKQEKKNRFRALCREYLIDGKIDSAERVMLDNLANELGLDKQEKDEIFFSEFNNSKVKSTGLDKASTVVFMQVVKKFKTKDMQGVAQLLPKLRNIEANYDDNPVKFYYFLITSVLLSQECISRFSSHKEDNYWLTYWSTMSYIEKKQIAAAEEAKSLLSNWPEYNEENGILLDAASSIKAGDYDTAEAFHSILEGTYSAELSDFAGAISYVLGKHNGIEPGSYPDEQAFYLEGFFADEINAPKLGIIIPNGTYQESAPVNKDFPSNEGAKTSRQEDQPVKREAEWKESERSHTGCSNSPYAKYISPVKLLSKEVYVVQKYSRSICLIGEDKKLGLWNSKTEELILPQVYDYGEIFDHLDEGYVMIYSKSQGNGVFIPHKHLLLSIPKCEFVDISDMPDFMLIRKSNSIGLFSVSEGEILLDPIYDNVYPLSGHGGRFNQYFTITDKNGGMGLYDSKKREIVVPCSEKYTDIIVDKDMSAFRLQCNNNSYSFKVNQAEYKYLDYFVLPAGKLYCKVAEISGNCPEHIGCLARWKGEDVDSFALYSKTHPVATDLLFENYDYVEDLEDIGASENGSGADVVDLIFVQSKSNHKWGLLDTKTGNYIFDMEYDDVNSDGNDGSPVFILEKNRMKYSFDIIQRKFV